MVELRQSSPFTSLAAVEAWDAWFRWREQSDLHDVFVDDTWGRVAEALASVESGAEVAAWQQRFVEALASWRLLPDERVLASAGTSRTPWRDGVLHAALNAAAFVSADGAADPSLDLEAFRDCAALAVRALDSAALLAGMAAPRVRIGMVGVADALALLGLRYGGAMGRAQSAAMARALAEGCLQGSIMLAQERGARDGDAGAAISRAGRRGMPAHLLRDAESHGLRHAQMTAITSQPRLALLANDVADALDPLRCERHAYVIAGSDGLRTVPSSRHTLDVLWCRKNLPEPETVAMLPWVAQIEMRVALQSWIDEPISYPLLATKDLGDAQRLEARKFAASHGLCEPAWREAVELQSL